MTQFIHVISNTTNISPTDIWKLSDPNIKPQQGQQISLGFIKISGRTVLKLPLKYIIKKCRITWIIKVVQACC